MRVTTDIGIGGVGDEGAPVKAKVARTMMMEMGDGISTVGYQKPSPRTIVWIVTSGESALVRGSRADQQGIRGWLERKDEHPVIRQADGQVTQATDEQSLYQCVIGTISSLLYVRVYATHDKNHQAVSTSSHHPVCTL